MSLVHHIICFIVNPSHCFYCCWFIALLVLLLVHCVTNFVDGFVHCWWWRWFVMLMVVSSLCCQCYYWSIALLPRTGLNPLLIVPLRYSFVVIVVSCYSCCMCFGEVLPLLPLLYKWSISGFLHCCTPPAIRYPPPPFTPLELLLLLLVCCVVYAMVRYYPFPLPCASGGTFIWFKKEGEICMCLKKWLNFFE